METEVRAVREGELEAFFRMTSAAFSDSLSTEEVELASKVLDPERVLVATEGDAFVAGTASVPFQLTVPGGRTLACAGISAVGTLPTHRRRGLSAALMRRQLEDVHGLGEPLAYLWASEGAIYQRFGYGLGSYSAAFRIPRERTAFLRELEPAGRVRLLEREDALKVIPEVYERVRPTRPGMTDRSADWLAYWMRHDEAHHRRKDPWFFAIHETAEGVQGYAVYSVKEVWEEALPENELEVIELVAATDDAYAALWRFCFGVDLVRLIKGWKRPIDEPLMHMLLEPRALHFQVRDGTWVRLVDVAAALEGRTYAREGGLVLEVRDDLAPWNQGTYELDAGSDGATCKRTDAEPQLSMRVEDLAAAYLGTVPMRALATAGRVVAHDPDALKTADAMFASPVAPWCPWIF